jgi:hypothetical protein
MLGYPWQRREGKGRNRARCQREFTISNSLRLYPLVQAQAVDAAVMASCDSLDGVVDGLIQNPAACNILPSALTGQGILTMPQANALQAYILPETDPSGLPLFPGMPISDLSTANFIAAGTDDEIATAPPFPTAAEAWGDATCPYATCGGLGPAAWSLGEVGIKAYVEENQFVDVAGIATLKSMVADARIKSAPTHRNVAWINSCGVETHADRLRRVSTVDQNLALHRAALTEAPRQGAKGFSPFSHSLDGPIISGSQTPLFRLAAVHQIRLTFVVSRHLRGLAEAANSKAYALQNLGSKRT